MVHVETSIREVESLLVGLEKSLLNLRLPTPAASKLFANDVQVVDVLSTSAGVESELGTVSTSWRLGSRKTLARSSLAIWKDFLRAVRYLKYAEFRVVDATFTNSERQTLVAEVRFASLARTPSGYQHATSEVELTLQRSDSAKADWRINAWKTRSFETTDRAGVMFDEVLDDCTPASLTRRLRRSLHEEAAAKMIQERTPGQQMLQRLFPEFDVSSWMRHPGLSVVDFDGDGFDDIFITRRVGANTLLRNCGDGSFLDATQQSALTTDFAKQGFANTALFADFDNDGDQDAFVGRSLEPSRYYENVGGQFRDASELISEPLPAHVVSISAADYNNDGLLDVYLSRYLPTANGFSFAMAGLNRRSAISRLFESNRLRLTKAESREYAQRTWAAQTDLFRNAPGLPNILLKNVGGGRFVRAAEGKVLELWRPTYQSTWADYDNDGDMDLYIANDFSPNHLFRNDGGKFTDVTASSGTADNGFGMGASWGDFDSDGQLDLYVTNMSSKVGRRITRRMGTVADGFAPMARGNSLFRQTHGAFVRASGTGPDKFPVEHAGWGWGSQFMDIDNDGDLDLFAPAGYYTAPPSVRTVIDT